MRKITTIIFSGLLFVGCAAKSTSVGVSYDFQDDFKLSLSYPEEINIYIERFTDVRGSIEKNLVGEAKTGILNKSTPILLDEGTEEIATEAMRKAFLKAGFNVINNRTKADLIFKGRINSFWVQEYATGNAPEYTVADVEFDVALFHRIDNKPLWYNVKKGYVKSGKTLGDITAQNERIMNEALSEAVAAILDDPDLEATITNFIDMQSKAFKRNNE